MPSPSHQQPDDGNAESVGINDQAVGMADPCSSLLAWLEWNAGACCGALPYASWLSIPFLQAKTRSLYYTHQGPVMVQPLSYIRIRRKSSPWIDSCIQGLIPCRLLLESQR